jgi:uncharacterized protein YmfQ (DUF2313 family)
MSPDKHITRSGEDYAEAMQQLLPLGQAWPRDYDSVLMKTVRGLTGIWGNIEGRASQLLEIESDPRTTTELLPDWERNWGLPDPCMKDPPTSLDERRQALVTKMTSIGGQSRQYFIDVAKQYGYEITITEYAPYMTGVSLVGDTRGLDNKTPPDDYRWRLGPPEMRYYWTVHVSATKLTYFHCNSSQCGIDRLLRIGLADDLECILDELKPAHTDIVFDYSPLEALDFTQSFNSQYLALGMM